MSLNFPPMRHGLIWSLAAMLVVASPLASPFAAALSAADAATEVDLAVSLKPFVDNHTLAGAVTLVANKGGILSHQAIGMADIAAQKPMTTDAVVWIASMSKPLTAAAFMMLVDEGKVSIEDPVAKYLPEYAEMMVEVKQGDQATTKTAASQITVRQVLSHTSGLPFLLPAEKGKIDVFSIADSVSQSAKLALKFEPGSAYQYSNCGINAAGRIIEVVSGKSYEQFMQERLFTPLGMKDTTSIPNAAQMARLAKSYRPTKDKTALEEIPINYLTYPLAAATRHPCPGGGFFSTASDLAAFGRMLLNGGELDGRRYLSAAALTQMTSKQTGMLSANYGLGCAIDGAGNGYGHGGAYATDLWIDTKHQLVTIYLVQHNGYAGSDGGKLLPTFKQAAVAAFSAK
jgi:CubicO group peptidase (beta-lactamase class C family)